MQTRVQLNSVPRENVYSSDVLAVGMKLVLKSISKL